MKKQNLIIACLCFVLALSCSVDNKQASVEITLKDHKSDTVYLLLNPYDYKDFIYDTIIAENGVFKLDTMIEKLHIGVILTNKMKKKVASGQRMIVPSQIMRFFIYPNEKIKIKAELSDFGVDYSVNGNDLNKQYLEYKNRISNYFEGSVKLFFDLENLYAKGADDETIKKYSSREQELYEKKLDEEVVFIKDHPNYNISAYLMDLQDQNFIIEEFHKLDSVVQNSEFGFLLKQKIDVWKNLMPGGTAPDFEYTTLSNETFILSEQEKYIVLDFWGTWCGGCVLGIPNMKQYYEKYSDKMEMVSIACRDKMEDLKKVIQKYEMTWTQILNNEDNDLSTLYAVKGYPTKIIIDPQGKIVDTYLGEGSDFYEKLDELLK